MLDRIFRVIQRVLASSERDLVTTRFDFANKSFERLENLFVSSFAKKD